MFKSMLLLYILGLVCYNDAARILAYYPTPSISHQVVFRPLTLELAKKGHEVVVITPDPIFKKGETVPPNLTEIDVHELSYTLWRQMLMKMRNNVKRSDFGSLAQLIITLVETQLNSDQVQGLMKDKTKTFDLVIVEAMIEATLGLAHFYKAPVIQFSSMAVGTASLQIYGTPIHPFIYPTPFHEKVYNLTAWEKLNELHFEVQQAWGSNSEIYDGLFKRVFGPEIPSYEELRANVDLLFINVHSLWDSNRPVPPNVIYLGGLHQNPKKDLPEDLQKYLDASKNGVIYVSFGSNVDPAMFPPEKLQALLKSFAKQPYDVLWKWNHDELPGRPQNVKISKWFPQSDLLHHPKVKLFVTQGGLQSTDEAINAETPVIGIPIFSDQKFNVEQYVHFGIGERVTMETLTEENLSKAISTVLGSDSYKKNIAKLRAVMNDYPAPPLEKAVWWTEYVIRHKGAKQLRSPAANMSIAKYLEIELVLYVLLAISLVIGAFVSLVYFAYLTVCSSSKAKKPKAKKN